MKNNPRLLPGRHDDMLVGFAHLRADRRGVVAFEMPFVYLFLVLLFFMPLADLATFGFQFISAYQALRDIGQYAQSNIPPDVTNTSSWVSGLPSTGYAITANVYCGNTQSACTASSTVPKPLLLLDQPHLGAAAADAGALHQRRPQSMHLHTHMYTERFE